MSRMRHVMKTRIVHVADARHLCAVNYFTMINKRELARLNYTSHGMEIAAIAQMLEVEEPEVKTWAQEGRWDLAKRAHIIDRDTQIARLYDAIDAINKNLEGGSGNPKDADTMMKFTASIKNLETDKSVSHIIGAAEEFIKWLYEKDMQLAQLFTSHFDQFIKERAA